MVVLHALLDFRIVFAGFEVPPVEVNDIESINNSLICKRFIEKLLAHFGLSPTQVTLLIIIDARLFSLLVGLSHLHDSLKRGNRSLQSRQPTTRLTEGQP